MYYKVNINTESEVETLVNHLTNNNYNFFQSKKYDNVIFVLEDEIDYVETIAEDNNINIEICE